MRAVGAEPHHLRHRPAPAGPCRAVGEGPQVAALPLRAGALVGLRPAGPWSHHPGRRPVRGGHCAAAGCFGVHSTWKFRGRPPPEPAPQSGPAEGAGRRVFVAGLPAAVTAGVGRPGCPRLNSDGAGGGCTRARSRRIDAGPEPPDMRAHPRAEAMPLGGGRLGRRRKTRDSDGLSRRRDS